MDQPSSADEGAITLRIRFKTETLGQFVARYGGDMGPGGIFIRTREPLAVGTKLRFNFSLADGSALLVGRGTVAWIRENEAMRAGSLPGMGVRFDALTPETEGTLRTILDDKSRKEGSIAARFEAVPAPAAPNTEHVRAAAAPTGFDDSGELENEKTQVTGMGHMLGQPDVTDEQLPSFGREKDNGPPAAPQAGSLPEPSRRQTPIGMPSAPLPLAVRSAPSVPAPTPPSPPIATSARPPSPPAMGLAGAPVAGAPVPVTLGRGESDEGVDTDPFNRAPEGAAYPAGPAAPAPSPSRSASLSAQRRGGSPLLTVLGVAALVVIGGLGTWFIKRGGRITASAPAEPPAAVPAAAPPSQLPVTQSASPVTEPPKPVAAPEQVAAVPDTTAVPAQPLAAAPAAEPEASPPVAATSAPVPVKPGVATKPAASPARPVRVVNRATPRPVAPAPKAAASPTAPSVPIDDSAPAAMPAEPVAAAEDPGSAEDIYWLRVRSVPAGAEVLIDGQVEGKTPFQRRIFDVARPYALTVRKSGFEAHEQMLSASDEWVKKGNVRTLIINAKLAKGEGAGAPAGEGEPADKAPDSESAAPSAAEGASPATTN